MTRCIAAFALLTLVTASSALGQTPPPPQPPPAPARPAQPATPQTLPTPTTPPRPGADGSRSATGSTSPTCPSGSTAGSGREREGRRDDHRSEWQGEPSPEDCHRCYGRRPERTHKGWGELREHWRGAVEHRRGARPAAERQDSTGAEPPVRPASHDHDRRQTRNPAPETHGDSGEPSHRARQRQADDRGTVCRSGRAIVRSRWK